MVSDLVLPENRPGLEWVASIPAEWTTPTERLLLVALALDSFDGFTCAPGRDALMAFCGVRHVRTFQRLRDSLTTPNTERPALLAADIVNGRHTRYRLLRPDSERLSGADSESLSGEPDLSAVPDSERLSGSSAGNHARPDAVPVSSTCQQDLSAVPDSDSLSHPSLPLPTLREGERKGEALTAPPPDGGALTRLPVAKVRDIITAVIPEQAQAGINCGNFDLGDVVTTVLARGWTVDALAVVLGDMGKASKSPTGQAISRLRALADTDPQAVILPTTTTTTTTSTATVDVFAEQDQQAVRLFCKWTGADRDPLAATLAEFVGRGLHVEADLYRDNYSNVALDLPGLNGETFWIDWEAFDGTTDYGHEACNVIRACFDGLPLTDAEYKALARLGKVKYKPERDDFEVSTDRPSIAALRRFVDVAHPIALAAAERATQQPPAPAKATPKAKPTPTPADVSHVLANDPRRPGADGFAHFDPPGRATHRPPGHDQAVRQADDLERKRQQRALADIDDPAILEALAALQANGIPADPQQENTP